MRNTSTITTKVSTIHEEGKKTKYRREIQCPPQTVELKELGNNSTLFILTGTIINSYNLVEIGTHANVNVKEDVFSLNISIEKGIYTINK